MWIRTLILFLMLLRSIQSESPAYVLNEYNQLVTSSSLLWVKSNDGNVPTYAVEGGKNGSQTLFICRATDVIGQLDTSGCWVTFGHLFEVIRSGFEVLVNVDGSARTEWISWKQFDQLPAGAVSVAENIFVARQPEKPKVRHLKTHQRQLIGGLNLKDGYGLITFPPKVHKGVEGQLLVEYEPIRYEIHLFHQGKIRYIHSEDVTLDQPVHLKSDTAEDVGRVFSYSYNEMLYFGKGQNIPTGSEVSIEFTTGSSIDIKWGLPKEVPVTHRLRLNYDVPMNYDVEVKIMATRIQKKLEYSGKLIAHYKDNKTLSRPIHGVYKQVFIEHLRPVYGLPTQEEKDLTTSQPDTTERPEQIIMNLQTNHTDHYGETFQRSAVTKPPSRKEQLNEWRLPREELSTKVFWSVSKCCSGSSELTFELFCLFAVPSISLLLTA